MSEYISIPKKSISAVDIDLFVLQKIEEKNVGLN